MSYSCFEKFFEVSIPYDADCVHALGKVMGKVFDRKGRVYTFPSTQIFDVIEKVRPYFPDIANKLERSRRFAEDREQALNDEKFISLSRAKRVRFDPPVPDGCKYLPYQKAGIYYSIRNGRDNVLIADSMGLGKSCQAIGIVNHIKARTALFIVPNSAKINWQREIQRWSTTGKMVGVVYSADGEQIINKFPYIIINYDILKKFHPLLMKKKWDIVICDEAHMIKNTKSQRTKYADDLCEIAGYRALLTGTPIVNRPFELWSLLQILNIGIWNNWHDFIFTFCGAYKIAGGSLDYKGSSNQKEFQRLLRKTVMVRRLKEDVLTDLPPKRRQIIEIPMTSHYNALIKTQEKYIGKIKDLDQIEQEFDPKESAEKNEERFKNKILRTKSLTFDDIGQIAAIRHQTAILKAPEVAEFAYSLLESKAKIGIYAHHKDVQQYFIKFFGKHAVHIVSGMTVQDRQRAVDLFQNEKKIRVFVGSIYAAGTAITLTAADTCVMAEMDWVPGINMQVEDRFHRIGTINPVLIYYPMLQNSLDYYIGQTVVEKMNVIDLNLNKKEKPLLRKRTFSRRINVS